MFIIIHGPLERNFLLHNLSNIKKTLPNSKLIISAYDKDIAEIESLCDENYHNNGIKNRIKIISNTDIFNPGFFNINRQINLINTALREIPNESDFIIKVRMDQTINYKKFIDIYNNKKKFLHDKLITTNCYTRKDRMYHPSDMFLAGTRKTLMNYYPKRYFTETHMDCLLRIRELVRNGKTDTLHLFWPESRLFLNYLNNIGEITLNTKEDSEDKLKKHIYIINSWDIGLRWKKFINGKIYVLPYFFVMEPFPGGPLENAKNYLASELIGHRKIIKENIMDYISRIYFRMEIYRFNVDLYNKKEILISSLKRVFDSSYKFLPPILHPLMYKLAKRVYYVFK
ncbi:WavE lipopolysaccharide synthesis family protein [Xenorhabdus sp. KJ12.1]|uniref:WavE lipopolysaccharide synthesis family protein n=1 Tax=Xenorhabdus sp. KJ12.1 TaxID=1851571 RepID=UPI000C03DC2B|nr:WavE lipopolysaccharide synthesis family protein [Xenorhabdus sp. KJ12.1]PHM66413.1 hypothetical protein Xekj_04120 [Xenorhabdus sp. KJ12.1]